MIASHWEEVPVGAWTRENLEFVPQYQLHDPRPARQAARGGGWSSDAGGADPAESRGIRQVHVGQSEIPVLNMLYSSARTTMASLGKTKSLHQ
jgi:hypothetical protein